MVKSAIVDSMTSARFFDTMGKRMRILREDKGLNQTELAQRMAALGVGVDPSYLSQIESDAKLPRLPVFAGIARALGTTTDYLLLLADDPTPPGAPMPETPCYFCEEADAAAQAIDAMQHPALRRLALRLVLSVAEYMAADDAAPGDGGGVSAEEWRALEVLSPGRGKPRVIAKE